MFINIEIERQRRYMSKSTMATKLDISVDTLNDWVYKRNPIPADKLRALSQLFDGMSIDYLLKGGDKWTSPHMQEQRHLSQPALHQA